MLANERGANSSETCKWGHAWSEENIRVKPDGAKVCRTCQRIGGRERSRMNRLKERESA
jgi:ligand-binding sensor protein